MSYEIIILIVISHFIGDFIMQSDYVAKNKSKSNIILGRHSLLYGIPFLWLGVWFYVVTILFHFITDYITSRASSYMYSRNTHWFFTIIGLDQMIHIITLVLTYKFIIGYA